MTTVQNLACSCVPWCQPREQRKMHERQSSPTNLHGRLEVIMRLSDLVFGWKRPTSALQAPRPPSISFRRGLSPNRWLSTSDAGRALSRVPLPGSAACATPTSRPASLTSVRRTAPVPTRPVFVGWEARLSFVQRGDSLLEVVASCSNGGDGNTVR